MQARLPSGLSLDKVGWPSRPFIGDLMPTRREFLLKGTAGLAAAASSRIAYAANANTKNDKAAPKAAAAVVETVLGPLDVSKLGFTLSHEHVCFVRKMEGRSITWKAFSLDNITKNFSTVSADLL